MISKNQFKFIRQLDQKKYRRREGLFVAEGTKVVGDLLQRYQPHSLFATADSLALDGVQDPGNLGTIIRIADWFGIKTIYCSEDTVDAWNPKVVQATMGSIARINLIYIDLPELLDTLPDSFPVYGTLLDGEDIYQQPLSENGLISPLSVRATQLRVSTWPSLQPSPVPSFAAERAHNSSLLPY